jgi:HEAT repeat protein
LCWKKPGLLGAYMVPRPDAEVLVVSTLADVLTESTDPEARQQASELFCRLRMSVDPQIVLHVTRLAGIDDLPEVKSRAVALLGEAGARADTAVPALIEQLKDPDDSQRAAVVRALRRIGVSEPAHINALMTAAKNSDEGVCASIVNGFVRGDFGPIDFSQLSRLRSAVTSNKRLKRDRKGIIIAQTRYHPAWKR